jgi:tetratricopeptide (TPR) repeat protein
LTAPQAASPPPDELNRQALASMARSDARAAQAVVGRLLGTYPSFAPGWLTASMLALNSGNIAEARRHVERGLALEPAHPQLLVQHVRILYMGGDVAEAQAAALASEPSLSTHPQMQRALGTAAVSLGLHDLALRLLTGAAAALPQDPSITRTIAMCLRFLGRFDDAEAALDRLLVMEPQAWDAYPIRSQLRPQTIDRNHVAELENRLAALNRAPGALAGAAPVGEVCVRYALAKEYEDLGDTEKSFAHLAAGSARHRRALRYDVRQDLAIMAKLASTFSAEALARHASPHRDTAPIFVCGLPRSGTTLVDRILSSHPDVRSHGELPHFQMAVTACAGGSGTWQDLIARAARAAPADIGAAYLAHTARMPRAAPRFIDKMPTNYLYAGLIAAALPGACLVHVTRHPMANGYGLFKTLFDQGYQFSYDLAELGDYIVAYARLMDHWRRVLGGRLITVSYEALVSDQRAQTEALLSACGLSWNDECLAPHRNPAPTQTQSAVQVRQPINTQAIDHWRRFANHLHPLAERLRAGGLAHS